MALEVEGVVDGGVHAEKTLGGASRLEPLHFALSSSHRLMRVFGSVVSAQPLLMRTGQPQTPERRGVGAQLVSDQQSGCEPLLLEQLTHQPQRCPSVTPTLNQHVEDLALVINGTPKIHPLSGNPHHHLASRPGEFHPQALLEPCVNLSIHTAPDVQPPTESVKRPCLSTELLPLPVGSGSRLNNAVPSVQSHYRTFNPTTNCSAPVPRIGTLVLTVSAVWTPWRCPANQCTSTASPTIVSAVRPALATSGTAGSLTQRWRELD